MSMHKKELTPLERAGLVAHGLDIGIPSQLSDAFRQGIAFAVAGTPRAVKPIDFNDDVILPAHPISAGRSSDPVRVSFDAAEGDGRVWLMVSAEHDIEEPWIAIEGAENARELARLLNAWANGYTGGDDVKPEA